MAANLLDAPLPHIFFAHDCRNNPGAEANGFRVVDSLVVKHRETAISMSEGVLPYGHTPSVPFVLEATI
jgi:hypothetical protein